VVMLVESIEDFDLIFDIEFIQGWVGFCMGIRVYNSKSTLIAMYCV
jgi:hypothetical protein